MYHTDVEGRQSDWQANKIQEIKAHKAEPGVHTLNNVLTTSGCCTARSDMHVCKVNELHGQHQHVFQVHKKHSLDANMKIGCHYVSSKTYLQLKRFSRRQSWSLMWKNLTDLNPNTLG